MLLNSNRHRIIVRSLCLAALTVYSTIILLCPPALAAQPKGIFALIKANQAVDPALCDKPFIDGASIRATWSELEPEQGKFDWSYLDGQLAVIKKSGKAATIRIMAGANCPQWIFKLGVPQISFRDEDRHHKTFGKVVTMPIIWDARYLKSWKNFVQALGKRYSARKEIVIVHMSGPTWRTAEMFLPHKGSAPSLLREAGYSADVLCAAWTDVIDQFAASFPKHSLALNVDVPLENDGVMERVTEYAVAHLKGRLCLQGNWLSAHTPTKFSKAAFNRMVELHQKKNARIGFQMLGSALFRAEQQGPLTKAIAIGNEAGAAYFEIYPTDLLLKENEKLLRTTRDMLTK